MTPPFNTFPSTFLRPKIFYFFVVYSLYADNKITWFYCPGENTWCSIWSSRSLVEKIFNFQLVLEIRLTSNFLHRVFHLSLFQLDCFFFCTVLSVFFLAFWSCFSNFEVTFLFEEAWWKRRFHISWVLVLQIFIRFRPDIYTI